MKQLLIFFLLTMPSVAQKTYFVKDKDTHNPIAYCSVYTVDGLFKINSEQDGSFGVPDEFLKNTFVFDAVGYEPKQRSEEHTSELQSRENLVCRLLLEKKK